MIKAIIEVDCYIRQGMDEYLGIKWYDSVEGLMTPLTDWEARFMARESPSSDSALIDCSTSNGMIILEDTGPGMIDIYMPSAFTKNLDFDNAEYHLEMTLPGAPNFVVRLVAGTITLFRSIVR